MIASPIMVKPLKGPFHIQKDEEREKRIQIMLTYTPEQFQVTSLEVLNELRLEFESYQENQLGQIFKNLQREIDIKTALARGVPQIKNMSLEQLEDNILKLQLLGQNRLKKLIEILQRVYQRRIQTIRYQKKKNKNETKRGFLKYVEPLLWWLPPSPTSTSESQTKVGQAYFLEQQQLSLLSNDNIKSADKTE